MSGDDLIPLITTVPTSGTHKDAVEFISRQHSRLSTGAGHSFAITDGSTNQAVGQIGLWLRNIDVGRAREGLLRSWEQVGDEWRDMFRYSRVRAPTA